MNKCEKCGFLHYRTDPCRKPKKSESDGEPRLAKTDTSVAIVSRAQSTAPRTDVASCAPDEKERLHRLERRGAGGPDQKAGSAGTQALPVDTNSADAENTPHLTAGPRAPDTGVAVNHAASGGPAEANGASKFDRKAWMREYQRNYMRNVYRPKLKASKSNPNTPDRNDE